MKEKLLKYKTIISYFISSGFSFVVDLIAFTIILHFLKDILLSSYLARGISSIFNYIVNKKYVFKSDSKNSFFSYFTLVIVNITISGILVNKIYNNINFNATIIKAFIDGIIFVINYFLQKFVIFNNEKKSKRLSLIVNSVVIFIALFIKVNLNGLIFNYQVLDYLNMLIAIPIIVYLLKQEFKEYKALNYLSILFTVFMIVGYSFASSYSFKIIYKGDINILVTLIKFYGYYKLFSKLLNGAYSFLINHKFKGKTLNFGNHPFLYSILVLSLVYGMYLIFYYPGVINYDNANQIKEVLGLHTRYLDSIVVINSKVTLTNFNPILHTLLLGNLTKLGININNINLGIFLYTFLQEIVVISVLAYSIYFLKKEGVSDNYLLLILLFYSIIPFFSFYAMTAVKDTLFTSFVLLYTIYLYKYLKYKFNKKDYILFSLIMMFVILFRTNGAVLIFLSLPFTIFIKDRKKASIILSALMFIFVLGYNSSLSLFNIPNTSVREGLSIPFQQTARYVLDYGKSVTKDEKKAIDKVLEYDTLKERYNPILSDPVKNKYNKNATSNDLKEYLLVWFKMFFKHPDAYFNATLSNTYGYFYPREYNSYVYTNLNPKLKQAGYNYHFNDLSAGRTILKGYAFAWNYIPVLNLLVNCAFYTFVYLFLLVSSIISKNKKYIIMLLPGFSLIAMCFIGPANTYFRYVYPYAVTLPLIFSLFIREIKKKNLD